MDQTAAGSSTLARDLGLELCHVGAVVGDLQAAIRDEMMLGGAGYSDNAVLDLDFFDALTGKVVREVLDVAWVSRAKGRGTLELISPLEPDGPGTQARLLRERSGPSHFSYWCKDFRQAAPRLVAEGARLILAPLIGPSGSHAEFSAGSLEAILDQAQTCYLQTPGGTLIELNNDAGYPHMDKIWGPGVFAHLTVPSGQTSRA